MRLLLTLGVVCAALVASNAEVGAPCTSKEQCADDECCQIINIIIATKKRHLQRSAPLRASESGVCQRYKQAGSYCESFEVLNGYCGCAEGLTCRTVYIGPSTSSPVPARRDAIYMPGYASLCTAP